MGLSENPRWSTKTSRMGISIIWFMHSSELSLSCVKALSVVNALLMFDIVNGTGSVCNLLAFSAVPQTGPELFMLSPLYSRWQNAVFRCQFSCHNSLPCPCQMAFTSSRDLFPLVYGDSGWPSYWWLVTFPVFKSWNPPISEPLCGSEEYQHWQ